MPDTWNEERMPKRSMRDIFYVLFRHKRKAIPFFLAVVITVTFGTLIAPRIYKSEAKIMLRLGRENVALDPTVPAGPILSIGQTRESELKSEIEILTSRDLIEKVVDAIGPATILNPPERMIEKSNSIGSKLREAISEFKKGFQQVIGGVVASSKKGTSDPSKDRYNAILLIENGLDAEPIKNSNIITISFLAGNRKLAQEIINKLIEFFLEKHMNVYRPAGSYEFFDEQTAETRKNLVRAEESLRELKNSTGIASLDEQRRVLLQRISDLQREAEETRSALAASRAKVLSMEKTLANLPPTVTAQETTGNPNPGADQMRARLYDLQLKEQDLLSRYTENSRPVQEIRRQIAEAQALLSKEERTYTQVTTGPNEAYKQVESALLVEKANHSSLQAKAEVVQEQLKSALGELKTINDSEIKLSRVQREMGIQEANYRKYYEKLEQARIDQALEIGKISNVSVVQPATYPVNPIKPNKKVNLALGLFLGLFGGIGLAFFSEYIDHTFRKPEDIEERLKLPTLAAIPDSGKKDVILIR
jgi:uncharacterized protein involved in exopolysaccharide biosynthesis